jgi:hypothetical protein
VCGGGRWMGVMVGRRRGGGGTRLQQRHYRCEDESRYDDGGDGVGELPAEEAHAERRDDDADRPEGVCGGTRVGGEGDERVGRGRQRMQRRQRKDT